MSVFHVVYGLRVISNLPLPGVTVLEGEDSAQVQIRLKDGDGIFSSKFSSLNQIFYTSPNTNQSGDAVLQAGTLNDGEYYGFFYTDGARFAVDRQGREIWGDWPDGYTIEDACTYLIGPIINFVLRLRGYISLHASSIVIGRQAIAVMGYAGAGKSTTAAAFSNLGYATLSDDVAVLDDRGGEFLVQPGYPRVNLWPDSARVLFGSAEQLPHITPTWGKHYLALDGNGHRFQTTPAPLGAIYVIGDRETDLATPVIETLTAQEAFVALVANTYVNYLLDAEMRQREFEVLSRIVAQVPVRRARRADDPSKVFEFCETIVADLSKHP